MVLTYNGIILLIVKALHTQCPTLSKGPITFSGDGVHSKRNMSI